MILIVPFKTKSKDMSLNGYTKSRKEILGFGYPKETWSNYGKKANEIINCRCGRSIYDHPEVKVGHHYASAPYHGDLCPFLLLKE